MGWKNSPPIFSTATKTIADLANRRLQADGTPPTHPLEELAERVQPPDPLAPVQQPPLESPSASSFPVLPPPPRDPSLPSSGQPTSYVDVFVDDFVGLAQTDSTPRRVSLILMHAIDDVLRPLESSDSAFRSQPISVKKLLKGDCSWSTIKLVLGWVIDTVATTIHSPPPG